MLPQRNTHKYSSIVMLIVVTVGLCSPISIAFDQADSATERLKAISSAMSPNDLSEIRSLLEAGADPNVATEDGITPLHVASFQDHPEIVELLLEAGANVDAEASYKLTALHMASDKGHTKIVRLLLGSGADVNAKSNREVTPLHMASENGHAEIVKLLLEADAKVNTERDDQSTALVLASWKGHEDIVALLIDAGAKVNTRGKDNATPLHVASMYDHLGIVKLLLEAGVDVNRNRRDGTTALMLASERGHNEIVELLIESGANVNAKRGDKATALVLASLKGNTETVKLLIDASAKENADVQVNMGNRYPSGRELSQDNGRILIDASKDGGMWWYPQNGTFDVSANHQGRQLANYLKKQKMVVNELPRGAAITPDLLAGYDIVIRPASMRPYSGQEISAYREYVSKGGKLLLLSGFLRPNQRDMLAEEFGVQLAGASEGQRRIDRFVPHPITNGVKRVDRFIGSGIVSAPPDATIVAYLSEKTYLDLNANRRKDDGEPAGAGVWGVLHVGQGTIVFLGDTHTLELTPKPLTENILNFLKSPTR